jgi:hypothetical protein
LFGEIEFEEGKEQDGKAQQENQNVKVEAVYDEPHAAKAKISGITRALVFPDNRESFYTV